MLTYLLLLTVDLPLALISNFFFSVVEHLIAVRYFCDLLAGKKKIRLLLTITEIILKSLHLIVSHLLAELQGDLFSSSATNTTALLFHYRAKGGRKD